MDNWDSGEKIVHGFIAFGCLVTCFVATAQHSWFALVGFAFATLLAANQTS